MKNHRRTIHPGRLPNDVCGQCMDGQMVHSNDKAVQIRVEAKNSKTFAIFIARTNVSAHPSYVSKDVEF